jgi:hypothetical protein
MWVVHAAKMGHRWCVGDGRRMRFWEDHWFGSCSLAIQYWDIYTIVNKQGCTLADAWDGTSLKFTFRRTVGRRVMDQWLELLQVVSSVRFNDETDTLIWKYNSTGRYSVQSLYGVITDRGLNKSSHL